MSSSLTRPILAIVFTLALLIVAGPAQAVELENDPRPRCTSASLDPDGDGYGWENEQTCINLAIVTSTDETVDQSEDSTPAHDRAGEQRYAPADDSRPICSSTSLDPDNDGYGWENGETCIVRPVCSSTSLDPDGDGYGWENGQTCLSGRFGAAASSTPTEMQTNPICAACHTPPPPPAVVPDVCDGCLAPDFTGPPLPSHMNPNDPSHPANLPPQVEPPPLQDEQQPPQAPPAQPPSNEVTVENVLDATLGLPPDDPTRASVEDALMPIAVNNPDATMTVTTNHDGTSTISTTQTSTNQFGWTTVTETTMTVDQNDVPISSIEQTMTFDENNQLHHSDVINQTTGAAYSLGPSPSTDSITASDESAAMGDFGAYGSLGMGDVGSMNATAGDFGGYTADSVADDAGVSGAASFGGLGSDSSDADCGGCGSGDGSDSMGGEADGGPGGGDAEGGDDGGEAGGEAGPGGNGGV